MKILDTVGIRERRERGNNLNAIFIIMTSNSICESFQCASEISQENMESTRSSSGVGGDARARRLGKLEPTHTALFVCDIQEKFSPSITHFDTIVKNTERLVKVVNMLGIPVIATEQYPKVNFFFPRIVFPFLLIEYVLR